MTSTSKSIGVLPLNNTLVVPTRSTSYDTINSGTLPQGPSNSGPVVATLPRYADIIPAKPLVLSGIAPVSSAVTKPDNPQGTSVKIMLPGLNLPPINNSGSSGQNIKYAKIIGYPSSAITPVQPDKSSVKTDKPSRLVLPNAPITNLLGPINQDQMPDPGITSPGVVKLPCPGSISRFGKLLGAGAFGTVYEAKMDDTGETVAVKVIESKSVDNVTGIPVPTELDILTRIRHDNILSCKGLKILLLRETKDSSITPEKDSFRYYEVLDPDSPYGQSVKNQPNVGFHMVALLPIAEMNLCQYIDSCRGTLNAESILTIFYQICCGVWALHVAKMLHLDIKPDNILMERDPHNKTKIKFRIADFSLSGPIRYGGSFSTKIHLTPCYAAPETFRPVNSVYRYDTKVDVWSLGMLLAYMLLGDNYFDPNNYKAITPEYIYAIFGEPGKPNSSTIRRNALENIIIRSGINTRYGPGMIDLLNGMLNTNPAQRCSVEDILKNAFFDNFVSPQLPTELLPSILPVIPQLIHYKAFCMAIKIARNLGIQTTTFFGTIDLFHRIAHMNVNNTYEGLLLYLSISFLIVGKIYRNPYEMSIDMIRGAFLNLGIDIFDQNIKSEERNAIFRLGGLLNRENLLTDYMCPHQADQAFSRLSKFRSYNSFAKDKDVIPCSCGKKFSTLFIEFVNTTSFHKLEFTGGKITTNLPEILMSMDQ